MKPGRISRRAALGIAHLATLGGAFLNRPHHESLTCLRRDLREAAGAYRRDGLPGLMALVDARSRTPWPASDLERSLRLADAVAAISVRSPFRACLRRSLLRYRVLRGWGRPAILAIGAERGSTATGLRGHAWIELDGRPFREETGEHAPMAVFFRHPPDERGSEDAGGPIPPA